MTDDARSPTRVPRVGSPSSRARFVHALRRSRAAAIVRGAATRRAALTSRLIAPGRGAQRLRNRTLLTLQSRALSTPRDCRHRGARHRDCPAARAASGYLEHLRRSPDRRQPYRISSPGRETASPGRAPLPDVRWQREVIAVLHGETARAPSFATSVLPTLDGESLAAAAARGARQARGDRLCFALASSEHLGTGVLARLNAALDGDTVVAVAAAQVVHPVRARPRRRPRTTGTSGSAASSSPSTTVHRSSWRALGRAPKVSLQPTPIAGVSAACLLVDRTAYETAGGLSDYADIDVAMFDLCRRVRDARQHGRRGLRRDRARPPSRAECEEPHAADPPKRPGMEGPRRRRRTGAATGSCATRRRSPSHRDHRRSSFAQGRATLGDWHLARAFRGIGRVLEALRTRHGTVVEHDRARRPRRPC